MKRHGKGLSEVETRRRAERRAGGRCEFCRAPQAVCGYRFHLEHVIPSALGGPDALPNRALACAFCNLANSDRVRAFDPQTGEEVLLFNPREQGWQEHSSWSEDRESLIGRTACGRATAVALDLNNKLRRETRRLWFATGWLP